MSFKVSRRFESPKLLSLGAAKGWADTVCAYAAYVGQSELCTITQNSDSCFQLLCNCIESGFSHYTIYVHIHICQHKVADSIEVL